MALGGSGKEFILLQDYDNLAVLPSTDVRAEMVIPIEQQIARYLIEKYTPEKASALIQDVKGVAQLKPRVALPAAAAEVAYSLVEGLEKFKFDADVELFRRVVHHELPESAFYDQMLMLQKLKIALVAKYAEAHRSSTKDVAMSPSALMSSYAAEAALAVRDVMDVVKTFFPAKPADSVNVLRKALHSDLDNMVPASARKGVRPDDVEVPILKLFASNEHGNQGAFAEAVRDQHLEEICLYAVEVADAIASAASLYPAQPGESGMATVGDIRDCLEEVDPTKPIEDVNAYLLQLLTLDAPPPASGSEAPAIRLDEAVDAAQLAVKSKRLLAKRYGLRPAVSDKAKMEASGLA